MAAVASGPMNNHEFGELFSHVDNLVRYLWEHPSLADAALRDLPMPKVRDSTFFVRLAAGPIASHA